MSILDADVVVPPSNIKLGEMFHIFEFVDKVRDERERVGISDGVFIQVMVVLAGVEFPILLDEKKGEAWGELEGQIFPEARFSSRKSSVAFFLSGDNGQIFPIFGMKVPSRLIS